MGRWGVAVGPEVIKQIHDRIVSIAKEKGIAQGSKMRVDTTVVETNIHYPTDSSLLGDGVRVLTPPAACTATIRRPITRIGEESIILWLRGPRRHLGARARAQDSRHNKDEKTNRSAVPD